MVGRARAGAVAGGVENRVERGQRRGVSLCPSLTKEILLPVQAGNAGSASVTDPRDLERVWRRHGFEARVQPRSLPLAHVLMECLSRAPMAVVLAFPRPGAVEQLAKRVTACLSRFPVTLVLGDPKALAAVAPSAAWAALQPGGRGIIALPCERGWAEVATAAAAYHRRASDTARCNAAVKHLLCLPRREVEEPGSGPLLASLGLGGDLAAATRVGSRTGTSIRDMVQPQAALASGPESRVVISGASRGRELDACSDDELAAWASWCEDDSLNAAARLDDLALRPLYVRRPFAEDAGGPRRQGRSTRPLGQDWVGAEPAH